MKFENIKVYNFENALRGMRNPKNSWNLSDSYFGLINIDDDEHDYEVAEEWVQKKFPNYPSEADNDALMAQEEYDRWLLNNGILEINFDHQLASVAFIGPNDMKLAKALINGGSEHRKFLRQIMVTVDITAPLYWWKEFDTYKVGTTANSTSTMHKLTSKPITKDCFEIGDYDQDLSIDFADQSLAGDNGFTDHWHMDMFVDDLIDRLEELRLAYLQTKDKRYWKELVRWLPESWLQTRTVTMNYENVLAMVHQRGHHKLTEWSGDGEEFINESFIKFAHSLPYSDDFIFTDNNTTESK